MSSERRRRQRRSELLHQPLAVAPAVGGEHDLVVVKKEAKAKMKKAKEKKEKEKQLKEKQLKTGKQALALDPSAPAVGGGKKTRNKASTFSSSTVKAHLRELVSQSSPAAIKRMAAAAAAAAAASSASSSSRAAPSQLQNQPKKLPAVGGNRSYEDDDRSGSYYSYSYTDDEAKTPAVGGHADDNSIDDDEASDDPEVDYDDDQRDDESESGGEAEPASESSSSPSVSAKASWRRRRDPARSEPSSPPSLSPRHGRSEPSPARPAAKSLPLAAKRRQAAAAAASALVKRPKKCHLQPRRPNHPPPTRQPSRPPPPPPPPREQPAVGGFWFGYNNQMYVAGPDVSGRWLHAKRALRFAGGYREYWNPYQERYETYWGGIDRLPKLFHMGGFFGKAQRKGCCEEEVRVRAIMASVTEHEMEHRAWMPQWGEPAVGGSQDWHVHDEPAPHPDHPFFSQAQLQRSAGYSKGIPAVGGGWKYREGSCIDLPTVFLHLDPVVQVLEHSSSFFFEKTTCLGQPLGPAGSSRAFPQHRTAKELYDEWLQAEIIIGRKSPRGWLR